MPMYYHCVTTFELKDGRELRCEWSSTRWESTFEDPAEEDDSDPEFYFDGKLVMHFDELPRGLADLADQMYTDANKFNLTETYMGRSRSSLSPE